MTVREGLRCPPRALHVPAHVGTYTDEVVGLAAAVGLHADPDQLPLFDAATAHDARGDLVATEVGCAAPRQNVKTFGAKVLALADLVLWRAPDCLWTAHLRDTSHDAFRNAEGSGLADLFDNWDDLRRLVARGGIRESDGEKSITLLPAGAGEPSPTLEFVTRSERGGRGLSGRRVTFDEALFLKPSMLSAMVPVLSARSMSGDVQVRYLGSPGLAASESWRAIRDRGRAGTDPSLAWVEWAAERVPCADEDCEHRPGTDGCALDREDLVRQANLAVDRRIHIRFVMQTERATLTAEDFMRERLGWWLDPQVAGGDLDATRWAGLVDCDEPRGRELWWGVDVSEDRLAHIAVAWRRADGGVQVMLDEPEDADRPRVTAMRAGDRLAELLTRWRGTVMLGGPAVALERDLPSGAPVTLVSGAEFAAACGAFDDRLKGRTIWHADQAPLNRAVEVVRWRSAGSSGERAWKLKGAPEVGPLAAVTRALAGLLSDDGVSIYEKREGLVLG